MIDFKRKLIYIHIPKTGGSAIESALIHEDLGLHDYNGQRIDTIKNNKLEKYFPPKGNPHATLKETIKEINTDEFLVFTVIRNPWSRFASLYRYHSKLLKLNLNPQEYVQKKGSLFFKYNLEGMIGSENIIVLKQENLQEEFSKMLIENKREDVKLPIVNTTSGKSYREILDPYPNVIEQIREGSKKEIELFDYVY